MEEEVEEPGLFSFDWGSGSSRTCVWEWEWEEWEEWGALCDEWLGVGSD